MSSDAYHRGVASIPSRRSLDVQLGPAAAAAATAAAGGEDDSRPERHQHLPGRGHAASPEPPPETQQRRHKQRRQKQRHQQLHQNPQQRVRWSRMVAPTAPEPPLAPSQPPPPLTAAASAGLCQLVDFGETRELIRRQREAAKRLEEVSSIVGHLSLDKENSEGPQHDCAGSWSTFRPQPNSQFKQYVFQSPSKAPPNLPAAVADATAPQPAPPQQHQQQQLQRSRTSLGPMTGRAVARHRRPEPLGAALSREPTMSTSGAAGGVSLLPHRRQQPQARYNAQGQSSSFFLTSSDWAYGQFEHRRSKSFWLD